MCWYPCNCCDTLPFVDGAADDKLFRRWKQSVSGSLESGNEEFFEWGASGATIQNSYLGGGPPSQTLQSRLYRCHRTPASFDFASEVVLPSHSADNFTCGIFHDDNELGAQTTFVGIVGLIARWNTNDYVCFFNDGTPESPVIIALAPQDGDRLRIEVENVNVFPSPVRFYVNDSLILSRTAIWEAGAAKKLWTVLMASTPTSAAPGVMAEFSELRIEELS